MFTPIRSREQRKAQEVRFEAMYEFDILCNRKLRFEPRSTQNESRSNGLAWIGLILRETRLGFTIKSRSARIPTCLFMPTCCNVTSNLSSTLIATLLHTFEVCRIIGSQLYDSSSRQMIRKFAHVDLMQNPAASAFAIPISATADTFHNFSHRSKVY